MSALECGAACLAMILSYHGRPTRVSECRERCEPGRDGLTALALAQAARSYGLRVRAFSLEPEHLNRVSLPSIAHWNFNHFVVIERVSARYVEIVDPARGRQKLSPQAFSDSFTGVVLTFEPGVQFDSQSHVQQTPWLAYLRHYIGVYRGVLSQILLVSLILQILGLVIPFFTRLLVDQVIPFHSIDRMNILAVGMIVWVLTQTTAGALRSLLLLYLQVRLDSQVMMDFFEHLLHLPLKFFQQRTSGDLLMRLSSSTFIRDLLSGQSISLLLDGLFVIVYLGVLLNQSPRFAAIVFGVAVVQGIFILVTTPHSKRLTEQQLVTQAISQSYLIEVLNGIATVKAAGAEERALEHWSRLFSNNVSTSLKMNYFSVLVNNALAILKYFSVFGLLWIGTYQVLNGEISLGTMLALNTMATAFLTPFGSLITSLQQIQISRATFERLVDVLQEAPEQALQTVKTAPLLTGQIELRRVNFRYNPHTSWILKDISLQIHPGQKIALVGQTGSGKSTFAKLLLGLYSQRQKDDHELDDQTCGSILYDGLPIESLNYRTLRSQIGVVLQESFLFSGSIRDNITFNDPSLTFEQITAAARIAAIHNEIVQMPMGYETRISEGGLELSGGQRQRISIARALVRQPAILILDEATSHLDTVTEKSVYQNLDQLGCTQIVIAHRLSTIVNADMIVVFDQGQIAACGQHNELMATSEIYAALFSTQAHSPDRGQPPRSGQNIPTLID